MNPEETAKAIWRKLKKRVLTRKIYPDPTPEILEEIANEIRAAQASGPRRRKK